LYLFAGALAVYGLLRYAALGAVLSPPGTFTFFAAGEPLWTRLGIGSRVFLEYYVWDQLVALKLNPMFSSRFLLLGDSTTHLLSTLAPVAVLGGGSLLAWHGIRRGSMLALSGALFVVTSLLTLQILPTGTGGAFRLMFTPSLFLCLVLALAIRRSASAIPALSAQVDRWTGVAVGVLALSYVAATLTRMPVWESDRSLAEYATRVAPEDPMAFSALAGMLRQPGQVAEVRPVRERAVQLFQSRSHLEHLFDERSRDAFSVVATELAFSLVAEDPERAVELAEVAEEQFRLLAAMRGGRVDTNAASPYYVKALALRALGRVPEAIEACRAGLAITPHPGLVALLAELSPTGQPAPGISG
jgi:hypothetical protein